jgi:hypothetical protein
VTYLEQHPPARTQYRTKRRAQVTGAIVVHTAESGPDLDGPDSGAEAVARFISTRTDAAASYHSVVDADSICRVGRYEWEMFHEGTGGNRWSLGLSFATRAHLWPTLPWDRTVAMVRNGAIEAASMARWVRETTGIAVPARRITAAQYRAGAAGFISHAELDPTRRSDPGDGFPWSTFLLYYFEQMESTTMPTDPDLSSTERELLRIMQGWLLDNGANLGPDGADGRYGRLSHAAVQTLIDRGNDLAKANAIHLIHVQRLTAERDEARASLASEREAVDQLANDCRKLDDDLTTARAEVALLQRLEAVATTGPALLALIQRGRAELHQLEADLAAIAPPAAG